MNRLSRLSVAALAASALLVTGLAAPAAAGDPDAARTRVVIDGGLSSPKGLAANANGSLLIGQGAFGAPEPVLLYQGGGVVPVTDPFNVVDLAVSPLDGSVWAIGGDRMLYHATNGGTTIRAILNIPRYQRDDPDPNDQEGRPGESNPYGLGVLRNGDVLVADAAGNDLIRVTPDGTATTLARFDIELVSTDHLPDPPPVEEIPAEAVPTSVVEGPGGDIYVGELKGFPFRPGSSRIWRIESDAPDGVLCSVNTPEAGCSSYREDLTAIQDIAFDRMHKSFLVYELAEDGVLAFEEGFGTGVFPPAVLLEVTADVRTELAAGDLSEPGGIALGNQGAVYVTDGIMNDHTGRLLRVR